MTHDLVERLRKPWDGSPGSRKRRDEERAEAADKLETYMAENAALRAENNEIRKVTIEEAATIAYVEAVKHCSARDGKTLIGHPVGQGIAAAIRNMGERA